MWLPSRSKNSSRGSPRKPPEAALRFYLGEPLVELAREVGDGRKARSPLGDVDGAVLARPIIEVLEQVLVKRPIAVGRRRKGQARSLRAARLGQPPFGLCKDFVVGDPEPVPKGIGARICVRVACQGQAAIWRVPV